MSERRSERRLKILKAGQVILDDRGVVNCRIRDISSAGARLEFDAPLCLPGAFRLRIVASDTTIPATVAWQRRLEAGISFTGISTVGAVEDLLRRPARSAA